MSACRNIVVLGGGISGLTVAYYLHTFMRKILTVPGAVMPKIYVLEKSSRVGGWIKSSNDDSTGAIFEEGPRSLRAVGLQARSTMALAEELGIADDIIKVTRSHPAAKNRFIYANNRLNALPSSLLSMVTASPPLSKSLLSYAIKEWRTPPGCIGQDESVHDFFTRRFSQQVSDYLVSAVLRGIIGGDSKTTSMQAFFPRLKAAEEMYGSVLRGFRKVPERATDVVMESALCKRAVSEKWAMWSFINGLQTLTDQLYQVLLSEGVDVRLQCPCYSVTRDGDQYVVHTANDTIRANVIISTLKAKDTASLLPVCHGELVSLLGKMPTVDMAVASLEYPFKPTDIPQGFGHLIPSCEPEKNLGVIYDSIVFPQHDRRDKGATRLTVMMGGAWFEDIFGDSNAVSLEVVKETAIASVAKQLGIRSDPVSARAYVLKEAIPQYPVGHTTVMSAVDKFISDNNLPLCLIGPSYDMPGVNDCVHNAKVQARIILSQWDKQDFYNLRQAASAAQ